MVTDTFSPITIDKHTRRHALTTAAIIIKVAVQGLNIQIIHSNMVMFLWLNNYL